MPYDVLIVGGGPAGLSAALTLGRARRRVLLCDAGPPRNAEAVHVHGFVTRDGVTPSEFRGIARQQLERYPSVEVREQRVESIRGESGAFDVQLPAGHEQVRRVLLCTGVVDVPPDIEGFRELWGKSLFQCPYCHGWEVQAQRFAYLALSPEMLNFALLLRGWTHDVVLLTNGIFTVPDEARARLAAGGVRLDERRIARLVPGGDRLERIEFVEGAPLQRDVLFVHPPQRQVPLVRSLGLALNPLGYVRVDDQSRETSRPGIYAGGDLTTPVQSAILAAASGMHAAGGLNHALTPELAVAGALE